ncbi:hypothetical protein [Adhaeribacter terreus]|uniref:DUF4625 domain-containing protein n=1 Tax=Adhaeribacter terreus TaxID=529703 RepID=A0ABW0ECY3_9BACT
MKNFKLKPAIYSLLFLFSAATVSSCGHNDDDVEVVPAKNEITITAPQDGGIVNAGQSVAITGSIVGEKEIHGYKISVRQKSDNTELFTKSVHDHAAKLDINQIWTLDTVARHKELELEILATLDHDGKTLSKKITLHALPAGVHNVGTITITSPTNMQMVSSNQTLKINATITGLANIHGYTLYIRNKDTGAELLKKEVHDHAKLITISETWTAPVVTAHTNLELEIVAALDHDGGTISKKVDFHAMP